jgi:Domain of unknown function (DUF6602)
MTPYEPGMSKSIVESYERDQDMARQPTNIQRTGHRVESRWDEVLSNWLPPQYAIGKRKYILLETEGGPATTKETDLVIFHPHYPEKLRTKESVLASGVAAAFSSKRTIDRDAVYAESHAVEQQGNCLGVERRPPLVNLEQND